MDQAGRKHGKLSWGKKTPPSHDQSTLDWDELKRKHAERLQQDIDNGVDDIMTRAELRRRAGLPPTPKKVTTSEAGRISPTRDAARRGGQRVGPRVDVDRIVELYVEGKQTVPQIAASQGCAERTVRYWLNQRKVYDPSRDRTNGGPPPTNGHVRREVCANGHDMNVHGVQLFKPDGVTKNGWDCVICRRDRNRENNKVRRAG